MNELKLLELFKDTNIFEVSEQINGIYFHPKKNFIFFFDGEYITSFRKFEKSIVAMSYRGGGYEIGVNEGELRMVTQTTLVEV